MLVSSVADPAPREPRRRPRSRASFLWRISSLGLELGLSIAIGLGAGYWLDQRLQTGGILTLAGILAGIGAAAASFMRAVREVQRDTAEDDASD